MRRGDRSVLEHLTFALAPGSLTALVGPNGAGKSTLLQAIAGQIPWTAGRIAIDGELQGAASQRCARLALMPQRSEMAWHFPITVRALVGLGLLAGKAEHGFRGPGSRATGSRATGSRASGSRASGSRGPCCQVEAALQRVGLQDLAHRRLDQLSGGQQQRALLARTLVGQAPLLLLDEPCAAVDPPARTALLAVLGQLRDAGLTLLVSSHDWGSDLEAYDRVLVLDRQLLAQGTPDQVRQTLGDMRMAPHGCG
ncbi:MAG: ABC transporter ATP-binding protein [Cyanobacteria bacterium]|nr:ABC transporter ATP-binding protein [Cyanobacteriota bacterium]